VRLGKVRCFVLFARALPFVRPRLQLSDDFRSAAVTSISRACALILLLLPEKPLLDLREDLVEPLLGAIGSLLIISYVRLQLRDPVFGRTEFLRELLSDFEGVLTVRLGYTRRLMQQTQDATAGAIQFVALVWRRAFWAGANWITDSDSYCAPETPRLD
jgi:hypothetical protein